MLNRGGPTSHRRAERRPRAGMATEHSIYTKEDVEEACPVNKPLSALTKAEATTWLKNLGEEPGAKWTSLEIKSRIKEILAASSEADHQLPKGLAVMKKTELEEECKKRGLTTSTHETRGSMMRKVRMDVEEKAASGPHTLMGFGKHSDMTYQEVADRYPTYVSWAKETYEEDGPGCNPKLRKFVRWVLAPAAKEKDAGNVAAKPPSKVESSTTGSQKTVPAPRCVRSRGKRGAPGPGADDAQSMEATTPLLVEHPTPATKNEGLVVQALERLGERMDRLEEKADKKKAEGSLGSWEAVPGPGGGKSD